MSKDNVVELKKPDVFVNDPITIGTGNLTFEYIIRRIMDVHNHPNFDISFNLFADFGTARVNDNETPF